MSDLENFVKDLAQSLGVPSAGLSYTEALHVVKALADNQRERSDACANVSGTLTGPLGAAYRCFMDMDHRLKRVDEFATLQISLLQNRIAELEKGNIPLGSKKPFRLEQTVFPVSYHTNHNTGQHSVTDIRLLGLVAAGTTAIEPSVLDLHLLAGSDDAEKLRNAVTGRKTYKLILEETEETF